MKRYTLKRKKPTGEVFVAALQTTYLKTIFKIFKPEQIKKVKAAAHVVNKENVDEHFSIGMVEIYRDTNTVRLDYDVKDNPPLTKKEIKEIEKILKRSKVEDLSVEYLEVVIPVDFSKYVSLPKGKVLEKDFIAIFKNTDCPDAEQIRDDLRAKNLDVYNSDRHNFRYRQMQLVFFVGASKMMQTLARRQAAALIDLDLNWIKNTEIPKWGSDMIGSRKTITAIAHSLGKYCVQEHYRLNEKKEWDFQGWNR